jgi:hypothetical protein
MNRSMMHALLLIAAAASLATPARADRLGKGRSLVLVGIGGHRGQFVLGTVAQGHFEVGEVGGELAYYRFLSDQWTLGVAGGYHASASKLEATSSSTGTFKFDTHSFTVRVGGDRYAFIDDAVALYAGPGIFFTRSRAKEVLFGSTEEGPDATEVGLNGRVGMYARLGRGTALFGHIGQELSRASAKDSSGKFSLWTSTHEGSVGLAFDF